MPRGRRCGISDIGYRLSIHKHTHKRYDGSPCYGPLTRVGNRACQQGARDQLRASIPGRNGERSRRCAQSQGKPRSTGQPGIQVQALRRPAAPTGLAHGCRAHAGLLRAGGRGAGNWAAGRSSADRHPGAPPGARRKRRLSRRPSSGQGVGGHLRDDGGRDRPARAA